MFYIRLSVKCVNLEVERNVVYRNKDVTII